MSEWVARWVAFGPSKPRHALLAGLGLLRCNFTTARRDNDRSGAVAFSTYQPVIAIVLWPSKASPRCAILYASGLEASMARVMITCLESGKPIYTGMSYDEITFETIQFTDKLVLCPECGRGHAWNKQDAYLESEEEAHEP